MPTQRIRLLDLETKYTRVRAHLSKEAIEDYSELFEGGSHFPALDVFSDGEKFYLVDGFHRLAAATGCECEAVECEVIDGTLRDALEAAIRGERNRDHGVRRSNADKRKAIEKALGDEEWRGWSDRRLADMVGVSDKLVAQVRKEVAKKAEDSTAESRSCNNGKAGRRTGKDGKKRSAKRPKAEKPAEPAAEEDGDTSFDPKALDAQERPAIDIKGLAAPYAQFVREVNAIRNHFSELVNNPREGGHLAIIIDRIQHDCRELAATISEATPVCVCEDCGGDGCCTCSQTGFWTRSIKKGHKAS